MKIWTTILFVLVTSSVCLADERGNETVTTQPFLTFFASSIDRIQANCEIVFDAVDRPDLSDSLDDRLKAFRGLAGIGRDRPLGMMMTWSGGEMESLIFLPVGNIEELLKTATFEIVGYHQVAPDQYEIERPEVPYHVLVKNGDAYFAETVESIRQLTVTPDQLTRGLRDQYELAAVLDVRQIPVPDRKQLVDQFRAMVEPMLQVQDDEISESANLRKALGRLLIGTIERVTLDTRRAVVGAHLDPVTKHFQLDVSLEAVKGSPLAAMLNRWGASRSDFSSLVSPDVPAGIAINLPLTGLIEQILGTKDGTSRAAQRLNAGIQVVGENWGEFTLIMALSGSDAVQLNNAIPELLVRLEKEGTLAALQENVDVHRKVTFHQALPSRLPGWISQFVGSDAELIVGQGKTRVWLGIGKSDTLLDELQEAVDQVEDAAGNTVATSLVRARFQANQLPQFLSSELLAPNVDVETARATLEKGGDGFSLTLEPTESGIRFRLDADEGLIRLIGRDWVKQVEHLPR